MAFAWVRGVLGQSICNVVSRIIAMLWHPLKAERDPLRLNLSGRMEDRVDYPLS
jgi:hypothetical protein